MTIMDSERFVNIRLSQYSEHNSITGNFVLKKEKNKKGSWAWEFQVIYNSNAKEFFGLGFIKWVLFC